MSYRKPRIALRGGETCDPAQVNAVVHPIATELSGRVIDHNIVAGTFPQSRVSDHCYYQVAYSGTPYYVSVESDMHIDDGGTSKPTAADANAWRVPDSAEWTTIDQMTVSPVTGESVLWLIAIVQYGLADSGNTAPVGYDAHAHIQFAFRVDGVVVDDVVTGLEDPNNPAPRQHYPPAPTDRSGAGPYSIHTFTTPCTEAMETLVCPVRMLTMVPVGEGTHTVELVARRLPLPITPGGLTVTPEPLYCYNRKILAVDLHVQAPTEGSSFAVELDPVEAGDSVSVAKVHTGTVATVATQMNDLGDGAIARAGLRNNHLPSRILYSAQVGLTTGTTVTAAYPGFGTIGVGGGWSAVNDGLGANCETPNGPFDFVTNPAFVILLGNVHVSNISRANPWTDLRLYTWFTIQGEYSDTTEFGNPSAEMAIANNNQPLGINVTGDMMDPIEVDVPLFEFFDFRTTPPAKTIDKFTVLGGESYGGGSVNGTTNYRKSNLLMLCLRK